MSGLYFLVPTPLIFLDWFFYPSFFRNTLIFASLFPRKIQAPALRPMDRLRGIWRMWLCPSPFNKKYQIIFPFDRSWRLPLQDSLAFAITSCGHQTPSPPYDKGCTFFRRRVFSVLCGWFLFDELIPPKTKITSFYSGRSLQFRAVPFSLMVVPLLSFALSLRTPFLQ